MTDLDQGLLRKLADWSPDAVPVTSLYLTVDGRVYPRRSDWEVRLGDLLRDARAQASALGPAAARSVDGDLERVSRFLRDEFERGDTRGVALFSSSDAGLWEEVLVPRPVRERAFVAPRAEIRMLEVLLETYEPTCTALVDYAKARLFVLHLGRIEEVEDVWDDVPGRHDQGGRSQLRRQRHVDDHRRQHLKHVAEALFSLWKRRSFRRLVLAGPGDAHHELEQELHPYLRERVCTSLPLPMTASSEEVRARTVEIEEELERSSERSLVDQVVAGAGGSAGAVAGREPTLAALAEDRVGTLVVRLDLLASGAECTSCGRLTVTTARCPACGAETRALPDVVEVAVAAAYGRGCSVETVVEDDRLSEVGGMGALLRY